MAEKDMTEKILEDWNDVFSDIVNVLLFEGGLVVLETDLEKETSRSVYKADGNLHEQERDTAKYWKTGGIRIALFGLENQTDPDKDMPLRLFGYDGTSYRAQLLTDKKKKKNEGNKKYKRRISRRRKRREQGKAKTGRYPVVTLVLYFGYEKHWDKPLTLLECLDVPDRLRPFVNDYRINLFEIAYLTDEQVGKFKSDFRYVADYFVQMRKNRDYEPPDAAIRHVHEYLQLMAAVTGDHRYEEAWSPDMEGRKVKMCEFLDKIENRGIEKGIEQGVTLNCKFVKSLLSQGKLEELKRAMDDSVYRNRLMEEMFPGKQAEV